MNNPKQPPMTNREQIITELLERYTELVDPMQTGNGNGTTGLLLMPATYTKHVRELERLLKQMHEDRATPLIQLPNGDKASIRSLWWHLTHRYIRATNTIAPRTVRRKGKHGKHVSNLERQIIHHWDNRVDPAKVTAGTTWLANNWNTRTLGEPMIPNALRTAA